MPHNETDEVECAPDAKKMSIQQLLVLSLRETAQMRKCMLETQNLLRVMTRHNQPANKSAANGTNRRRPHHSSNVPDHMGADDSYETPMAGPAAKKACRVGSLPLDGSTNLFGPGFRKSVVKAIAPMWFKRVGTQTVLLPYHIMVPYAMRACQLNHTDRYQREAFDMIFKSELSRTASKTKSLFTTMFMDQLLTIFNLPAIVDSASITPTNLGVHLPAFKKMRAPPQGFDGTDPRYMYMGSWHAAVQPGTGVLHAFQTRESRRLFEQDFFARCAAKEFLPSSAQVEPWIPCLPFLMGIPSSTHIEVTQRQDEL